LATLSPHALFKFDTQFIAGVRDITVEKEPTEMNIESVYIRSEQTVLMLTTPSRFCLNYHRRRWLT
jgi:hypothetical protein